MKQIKINTVKKEKHTSSRIQNIIMHYVILYYLLIYLFILYHIISHIYFNFLSNIS